jgi:thiol-disulfide isomerase/thioredoxin
LGFTHSNGLECDSGEQNANRGTQAGKRVIVAAFFVGLLVGTIGLVAASSLGHAVLFSRTFAAAHVRADKNANPTFRTTHQQQPRMIATIATRHRPSEGDIVVIKSTPSTEKYCSAFIGTSSAILVDAGDYQPYQVEASKCWLREEDVEFTGQRKDTMEGIEAPEITKLANSEEFQAKIEAAAREDKALVIGYFASWCRACKATKPKFMKITQSWPQVEFCEILFDNNKELVKSKGINKLPYFELYLGDKERVDALQCGPSKIQKLDDTLKLRLDDFAIR